MDRFQRFFRARVRTVWRALLLFALLFCGTGIPRALADGTRDASNLLAGRRPTKSYGVHGIGALTDGVAVPDGDWWRTDKTARFGSMAAFVEYDLGSERPIGAIWLQGDNNDQYDVLVSRDGLGFDVAWQAPPQLQPGLQARFASGLHVSGRYVRIRPSLGDDALALSEVQIFSEVPSPFPPAIRRTRGLSLEQVLRDKTLLLGFSLMLLAVLAQPRMKPIWLVLLAGLVLGAGAWFLSALGEAWPVGNREVSLVRGVVAATAACVVLREAFAPPRFPAHPRVLKATLGLCAALGFAAFYNLGEPQFYNVAARTPTLAHQLDLRQYYPTAKYFAELGYSGIYEADVLAHAEDQGTTIDALSGQPMRDLYSLADSTVSAQRARIEARRAHFSAERWREYRADARYFREAMGNDEYLRTMLDYGGNATPVWMSIAHLLFSSIPPSNAAFTLTGLIDAVLILGALVAIGYAYGVRTALVCAVVFGTNDFIMYGTNWGGSTLRHDWLAYLGFGAAALRRDKWLLGGVFFGLSTMIRAFPALALIGVGIQGFWMFFERLRAERRLPTWREFAEQNRVVLRVALGAILAAALTFAFSLWVLPAHAWPEWYGKVLRLENDPHPASVSLRSLFGGWESVQPRILRERAPVYGAALLGFVTAVVWACRGKRPEQAAILGIMLLPVLLSPANYYIHVVFLFPLLVIESRSPDPAERRLRPADAGIWLTLLGLCAVQYFTVLVTDLPTHFYLASALLITALAVILGLFLFDRIKAWLWAPQP